MKFRKDCRGLSLVELIVALAILSIIVGIVGGFVISGARASGSVNSNVALQTRVQMVQNQLKEYIIDANESIAWNDNKLTIVSDGNTCVFIYDAAQQKITYSLKKSGESNASGPVPLANDITGFSVTLNKSGGKATSAIITVTMSIGGKTNTNTQTIALRNRPVAA